MLTFPTLLFSAGVWCVTPENHQILSQPANQIFYTSAMFLSDIIISSIGYD